MSSRSNFYQIPGAHKPFNHVQEESTPLLPTYVRRQNSSYFRRTSTFSPTNVPADDDAEANEKLSNKLGTFDGVFVPTALNVLSILMFLRFGFIIGQMGILGTFLLLFMSYGIDLLTTLSISAIATNGTVRGGGAYYMISRSLGPEFGGSIGLVFYIGQVLNSGLNVVGFIEPFLANLGSENGIMLQVFPQGYWWEFLYSSTLLLFCICVALVGSQLVSKAGFLLFILLLVATVSVPISTFFVKPFEVPQYELFYSGLSWKTLKQNLFPHFTAGAAGSLLSGKETFNDLFGIFFPATAGIFAGASMSGDLRKPSKSIPKGTLWGLLLTFVCYASVILSLGAAVPRKLLHKDVQIIQTVNMSGALILIGEFSTSLFSVIVGIVGAANVLQAIAKDSIIPGLGVFSKVDKNTNNPIPAILLTWLLTQLCLFANVNQIATFITMAFLMTFIVTNLACFLLKIASAPNFRPSFRYFDWYTALSALIGCIIAMFIVDGVSASLVVIFLIALFIFIHYVCPPKPWGDVSQSLIYHQVRKYLLRLKQDNVKYWRPQILLLVDSPRSSWNLIQFCNNLKKGGLYILGHVIVTDGFQNNFTEFKTQQNAWLKLRDLSKVKAFVQIGLGPTLPWGVRNVIMGSGLGNMKPNIVIFGYFDIDKYYKKIKTPQEQATSKFSNDPSKPTTHHQRFNDLQFDKVKLDSLPTDECRNEQRVSIQNWVSVVEDLILMKTNVAIAKGFDQFKFPEHVGKKLPYNERKFIDLYPIQMSAEVFDKNGERSAMTTNFDTYTLILQLGAILSTVPNWKKTHRLRIVVFIEDKNDIENERSRINSLIEVLRIRAVILVVCLKDFKTYKTIIKGTNEDITRVDEILKDDEWWKELKNARLSESQANSSINIPSIAISTPTKLNSLPNGKYDLPRLQKMGLAVSMTTNRLYGNEINKTVESDSESEYDESISSEADSFQSKQARKYDNLKTPSDLRSTSASATENMSRNLYYSNTSIEPASKRVTSINANKLKNQRPNFSSEKVPRSKVIDDATGDEPSIMLLPDDQTSVNSHRKDKKSKEPKRKDYGSISPLFEPKHFPIDEQFEPFVEQEQEQDDEGDYLDISELSFNDLPAKGQHLILNDVMKTISGDVPVIFTTLPAPYMGTHRSEDDCKEYLQNLQVWLDGLPPILLINSQSMTVTTAL